MLRIREHYDADLTNLYAPTEYMVDENRFPMPCSVCGNEFYVDKAALRRFERDMEFDPDNTFVCRVCEEEYDELSHR